LEALRAPHDESESVDSNMSRGLLCAETFPLRRNMLDGSRPARAAGQDFPSAAASICGPPNTEHRES